VPPWHNSGDLNPAFLASGNELSVALMPGVNHNLLEGCQCPTGTGRREGRDAGVADLVAGETEPRALRQCPTGASARESTHAGDADLVLGKKERLALRQRPPGEIRTR